MAALKSQLRKIIKEEVRRAVNEVSIEKMRKMIEKQADSERRAGAEVHKMVTGEGYYVTTSAGEEYEVKYDLVDEYEKIADKYDVDIEDAILHSASNW